MARAFPDRRQAGARNPEVLPPPAAPPLRPERMPTPGPITFAEAPVERPGWAEPVAPVGPFAPVEPVAGGNGSTTAPLRSRAVAVEPDLEPGVDPDLHRTLDPDVEPVGPAGGVATALRQRLASPTGGAGAPVAVTIPRSVRMRAGVGLLIYVVVGGLALALVILGLIGIAVKTLGGI